MIIQIMLLVWQTIVKKSIETSVLVKLSDLEGIPMKAAKLTEHPSFRLMRQTDIQNVWHMQMPRWLFSDPRYADMSLDAKVTYTFLLNRFQLSRRNSWVNDAGEVFVIFPHKALAKAPTPECRYPSNTDWLRQSCAGFRCSRRSTQAFSSPAAAPRGLPDVRGS